MTVEAWKHFLVCNKCNHSWPHPNPTGGPPQGSEEFISKSLKMKSSWAKKESCPKCSSPEKAEELAERKLKCYCGRCKPQKKGYPYVMWGGGTSWVADVLKNKLSAKPPVVPPINEYQHVLLDQETAQAANSVFNPEGGGSMNGSN